MKYIVIALGAIVVIGAAAYFLTSKPTEVVPEPNTENVDENPIPVEPDGGIGDGAEPLDAEATARGPESIIGQSADGNDITAYHFGSGATEVLFVGGIHNGFAPNTVAVVETLQTNLADGTIAVPENMTVTVIPNLNPDATASPNALAGRLNSNGVDLNRNFDCEWQPEGVWRDTPVSGGVSVFSEPEAKAVRDYVAAHTPAAAVVYYAADGGVYASNCGGTLDTEIAALTSTYATASGYTANDEFDAYAISGDMTNWLAKSGIPAIGVLLSDYTNSEWDKNKAGIEAVIANYTE